MIMFLLPLALAATPCMQHDEALSIQSQLKKRGYDLMIICHPPKKNVFHCSAEFYTREKSYVGYGSTADEAVLKAASLVGGKT